MDPHYHYDQDKLVIHNYNYSRTFASFLPGIAGELGIPLWAFYVNRGQCISSFGVGHKNNPILEFFPADQAIQNVAFTGFRTFIKSDDHIYEPFQQHSTLPHKMVISYEMLEIQETNTELGIEISVSYTTITEHDFPALVRKVEIANISDGDLDLEILDGLPRVSPFGVDLFSTKMMSYTSQSWMEVRNTENKLPYFKIRAGMADTQSVEEVKAGNFYLCIDTRGKLTPIVDPSVVFGTNTSFAFPNTFNELSLSDLIDQDQIRFNRIPSSLFGRSATVKKGEKITIYGLIGQVHTLDYLNETISDLDCDMLEDQFNKNRKIIENIASSVSVTTANSIFDHYLTFCYLDNILRGGVPIVVPSEIADLPVVYHMYFRKHGDLERDYNDFYLSPEYYSQGNGNYRDINQNRRLDTLISPEVSYYNILTFMNLIQADGYNPLVLTGNTFVYMGNEVSIRELFPKNTKEIFAVVTKEFTPGSLLRYIRDNRISVHQNLMEIVRRVMACSRQIQNTVHGEGYWVDHFGYNLDLIVNYLYIFPDREQSLFFDIEEFTFHDSDVCVNPLFKRLYYKNGEIAQSNSVFTDEKKTDIITSRSSDRDKMRSGDVVYKTTLFNKLLALVLIKFNTLGPNGFGIEMEAGKPGWYDALNGLPGLLGSSATDMMVLKKLVNLLRDVSARYELNNIHLPVEIFDLCVHTGLNLQIDDQKLYWVESVKLRENYRERIRYGFSKTKKMKWKKVTSLIQSMSKRLAQNIDAMIEFNGGFIPTYFMYEITNSSDFIHDRTFLLDQDRYQDLKFEIRKLPLFLEGYVRGIDLPQLDAKKYYSQLQETDLFDTSLNMFKVNADLSSATYKIGRTYSFTPGWLENESVWLHMEYKFLLEMLKAGLYEAFYQHFHDVFIPFLDIEIYGRSTLENSSFIVSSAFPDSKQHGRGFYARLSGVTVEALNIVMLMFIGGEPYRMVGGSLHLCLQPAIPNWLFSKGEIKFLLHGGTEVTYINQTGKDTHLLSPRSIQIDDKQIEERTIPEPYSIQIRSGVVRKLIINLDQQSK